MIHYGFLARPFAEDKGNEGFPSRGQGPEFSRTLCHTTYAKRPCERMYPWHLPQPGFHSQPCCGAGPPGPFTCGLTFFHTWTRWRTAECFIMNAPAYLGAMRQPFAFRQVLFAQERWAATVIARWHGPWFQHLDVYIKEGRKVYVYIKTNHD